MKNELIKAQDSSILNDFFDSYQINDRYASMTKVQKKIIDYLRAHPEDIRTASITSLAKRIGTTPASLSRFAQFLHFKGFSDMRFCYEKNLFSTDMIGGSNISIPAERSVREAKQDYLNIYISALTDTIMNLNDHRINICAKRILNASRTYIYSSGTAAAAANYMYQLFTQIGIPCNYFTDSQLAQMSISHLRSHDVAIGINYSGESNLVYNALSLAKKNQATTIAITSHAQSKVGRVASIVLCYSFNIQDDLRHVHIARMCELAIIGQLQQAFVNLSTPTLKENMKNANQAVRNSRK